MQLFSETGVQIVHTPDARTVKYWVSWSWMFWNQGTVNLKHTLNFLLLLGSLNLESGPTNREYFYLSTEYYASSFVLASQHLYLGSYFTRCSSSLVVLASLVVIASLGLFLVPFYIIISSSASAFKFFLCTFSVMFFLAASGLV